ncbi:hypothetical protein PGTUg99_021009 [Puccinia graminis f. sp. tritici]|uniref:Uncharacterized protein n=1 Tax=Puccinia graminis f. sp. tritici TaxID=56615 RepID=A0A5B0SLS6_PUCGR|nr:hypothetical protein PGTUg99_021009 [Puccinia graminis f. sp. tritici]
MSNSSSTAAVPANSCGFDKEDISVSDDEETTYKEFTNKDIHTEKIFAKYAHNTGYNPLLSVYLDPEDSNRYILLWAGNVAVWAKAMARGDSGVDLTLPPCKLKFKNRKTKAAVAAQAQTSGAAPPNTPT